MRANRTNAGAYVVGTGAIPAGTSVAALDLIAWKNDLAATLPAGDGFIAVNSLAGGVSGTIYTITVQWAERDNATPTSFSSQTEI